MTIRLPASCTILIDADSLLTKPCPPLFPEWGTRLFVVSPHAAPQDWETIDYLLSAQSQQHIVITVLLLSNHATTLPALTDRLPQNTQHIFTRLQRAIDEQKILQTNLIYHYESLFDTTTQSSNQASTTAKTTHLITDFLSPKPHNGKRLSQQWLLPMGISALINHNDLLHNRRLKHISEMTVIGDAAQLQQSIDNKILAIAKTKQQLLAEKNKHIEKTCQAPVLTLDAQKTLDKPFTLPEIPEPPCYTLFYRTQDEQELRQWVQQFDQYPKHISEYNSALYDDYYHATQQVKTHGIGETIPAQTWCKQAFNESISHYPAMLIVLTQQSHYKAAKRKQHRFHLSPQDNQPHFDVFQKETSEVQGTVLSLLINSARKRPSLSSFWTLILVPILIITCLLTTGIVPNTAANPDTPIPLLIALLIGFSIIWTIIVGIKVFISRQQFKRHKQKAIYLIHCLQETLYDEVNTLKNNTQATLNDVVFYHNLHTIQKAAKAHTQQLTQLNFHHAQAQHIHQYYQQSASDQQPSTVNRLDSENIIVDSIDLSLPTEQQSSYFLHDYNAPLPAVYEGNTQITPPTSQQGLARYAGITKIIYKGR